MKTLILFSSVLFLFSFSKNSMQNVNVFDAIKNNQIHLTATSNGAHTGKSIVVEIENIKNLKSILIPSGTRFKSEFEGDQDLITVDDEMIALNSSSTQHKVNGFCVQPHNSSPTNESQFTIAKETNQNLIKIAKYLDNKGFNDDLKQTALWCVVEDDDVSGIYEDGNNEVTKLREFICSLTGKENVWYNSDPTYSIDENRNIIQETTKVEGLLAYTVTKTGNMRMQVLKENGEVIRDYDGEMPISHLGNYNFNFSLKVSGWESGKYSVQLKIGNDVIHTEAFVIS
ncbi:hypothetical protein ERX46_00325 [Brumimicrobium glaciale]|uniref:Uncharacterized protein n=1 Tax=Brumimicrobium glaciale TaxID=200475 RepID=A0A4Q4KPP9_9FLAO|nr:hypothetical protein [Brumimicrobium glaciale]RYM35470.1 hypothetical protein ERX46_00325 [Brumimicrobium glaciale]